MPYGPPLYGISWGHIFCNMGGGGGQNCFQIAISFCEFRLKVALFLGNFLRLTSAKKNRCDCDLRFWCAQQCFMSQETGSWRTGFS